MLIAIAMTRILDTRRAQREKQEQEIEAIIIPSRSQRLDGRAKMLDGANR